MLKKFMEDITVAISSPNFISASLHDPLLTIMFDEVELGEDYISFWNKGIAIAFMRDVELAKYEYEIVTTDVTVDIWLLKTRN